MFNQSSSVPNSLKLIRFFRIVGMFGGAMIFARVLIFCAIVSGILYFLP